MRVLKICTGTWNNASRDQRELNICKDLGMEVIVLAKGDASDKGREDNVNGFCVFRYTTRPINRIPVMINKAISFFQWARFASSLEPDIISGHDISGWMVGWLSRLYSRKKKPVFVYDAHEFELGRNSKRSKLQLFFIKLLERKAINKSAFTIVVNDSIADELVKIYKLGERPVVVRNIPNKWVVDHSVCAETRKELESLFPDCDSNEERKTEEGNNDLLLMYHGAVVPGRDVERLIELVSVNPNVKAVILGNVSDQYKESLIALISKYGVSNRVVFHPAVPLVQLWKYVGAVDAGVILARATCKNHLFSLPNKFFENIQSETPVVCPNYPAFKSVVDKYENGLMCVPEDIDSINNCIEQIRTDKELYDQLKKNTLLAKEELNWENEKKALVVAYSSLIQKVNG